MAVSINSNGMIPGVNASGVTVNQTAVDAASGGYEFTGGFTDRTTGSTGSNAIGNSVSYTSTMVANSSWLRFGFDSGRQITNDSPYWSDNSSDPYEAPHSGTTDYQGVGLFSGAYMPLGTTSLFSFGEDGAYNDAVTSGDLQYNAAVGSYDFSELNTGDLAMIRFDFNVIPQHANTTVEVGLIWATRDSNDDVTFTFPLLTNPVFFGTGTVGKTYLNRPLITAYFASAEDVNARALPAIRADNEVLIQPLTTLCTIMR